MRLEIKNSIFFFCGIIEEISREMKLNLNKILFSSLITVLPFNQLAVFSSDLLIANNNSALEELKNSKVNKKGQLIVKFCSKLSNYSGFVEVQNKKFFVEDAKNFKDKKLVWYNTNLPKLKSTSINTGNLSSNNKKIVDGDCDGVGILPLIILGAGIAVGGSGGSGSSSSN